MNAETRGVLSLIVELIVAIGAVATAVGVFLAYREIRTEFEERRRLHAIESIFEWSKSPTANARKCLQFAAGLHMEKLDALLDLAELDLTPEGVTHVRACLADKETVIGEYLNEPKNRLKRPGASLVATRVSEALNKYESVLLGGRHDVADPNILDEQLKDPIMASDVPALVEAITKIPRYRSGYPAIEGFIARNPTVPRDGQPRLW